MRDQCLHLFPPMDRVIYGVPTARAVAEEAERLGARRVFLIVSRTLNTKTDEIEKVRVALGDRHAGSFDGTPQHTSRIECAEATQQALEARADLVVAIGGGSVVDAAKIVLMCMEHGLTDADGLDGFEVTVGADKRPRPGPFRDPKVRMIAAPSTLSGGEYNAGCLVTDPRRKLKQTFFHPLMMPLSIILDQDLTRHTPHTLWVGSGTRAMDHGIEALCSPRGNPLADAVVTRGLRLLHDGLLAIESDPGDPEARRLCILGSWLSSHGLQCRVPMGASHAIGHVLGGTCDVPHYLCTPVMMPSILQFNKSASQEAQVAIAEALRAPGEDAGAAFAAFTRKLGLPQTLRAVGVADSQFDLIAKTAMGEIFTYTNARPIRGPSDIVDILKLAA